MTHLKVRTSFTSPFSIVTFSVDLLLGFPNCPAILPTRTTGTKWGGRSGEREKERMRIELDQTSVSKSSIEIYLLLPK